MLTILKTLLSLYPPKGLVFVGAGNGGNDIVRFLIEHSIHNVVLIESSSEQHQYLKEFIYSNKNFEPKDWCFLNEVVSKKKENVTYFVCNKSAEDGLINPELLTNIWPNLKLKYTETLESISLNATYELLNAAPNWLVINCLGAGLIIDFEHDLKNIDVLILRVLINKNEVDSLLEHSDFKTLKKYLEDSSFKTISTYQSNHPQIANAVFVRDYKMSVIEQTTALQEKDELINTLNAQHSVCEKALSESKQLAADAEQQLIETTQSYQKLIQEKDELIHTLNAQHSVCEKALSDSKQQVADVEQQLKETLQSHQKLIQEKDELIHTLNAQHSVCEKALSEQKKLTKINNYDSVETFIDDIAPFFYNKQITYVDAGACYGEILVKLTESKKIKVREAHLFEPNTSSFEILKKNTQDLKISSNHSYNVGLSDQSKTLSFNRAGTMTKVSEGFSDPSLSSDVFEIQCYSLDEMSKNFTDHRINLLKIDVEGSEVMVLKGAEKLLEQQKIDVIYIEVGFNKDGHQQVYFADVDKTLQSYGYRCFKIYEQKNEWLQDSPLLRRCNFAYMSNNFAKFNPYKLVNEIYKLKNNL